MTGDQIYLLRKSFKRIEQHSQVAALVFYQRLFELDPRLRPLFKDNIEEQLSGVKGANSVKIVGRDLASLERIADQVLREMNQVQGVSDLGIFRVLGQPNLNIKVDR